MVQKKGQLRFPKKMDSWATPVENHPASRSPKVEKVLRSAGLGKMVDDAITSMNRGAEEACKEAAPIFINAIKQMDVNDAIGILKGADTAATGFLRSKTSAPLGEAFKPVINRSLEKTGATKYWSTMINAYNTFSLQKINPDLSGYVTEKALQGIFTQIAIEEKNIRKDPLARTSDLLKKCFQTNNQIASGTTIDIFVVFYAFQNNKQ